MSRRKITEQEFLDRVRNPNYDFTNTHFFNMQTPIEVNCIKHGLFTILPTNMLYKDEGCKLCGFEKMAISKSLTKQEFIKRAKIIYGDNFDYSLVDYKNNKTNIIIICKKCGKLLFISPNNFLKGNGCPNCK